MEPIPMASTSSCLQKSFRQLKRRLVTVSTPLPMDPIAGFRARSYPISMYVSRYVSMYVCSFVMELHCEDEQYLPSWNHAPKELIRRPLVLASTLASTLANPPLQLLVRACGRSMATRQLLRLSTHEVANGLWFRHVYAKMWKAVKERVKRGKNV